MSAITLSAPSSQILTPFCDKKFQTLRFIASAISDICRFFFLKIAALFIRICNKNRSDSLNSYADYLRLKSQSHLYAFSTYGSQIIDFAINTTKIPKTPKDNEIEALKERYGERVMQKWSTIGTAEIPLRRAKLARPDMNKGCCFGMSMDFICHYLKALQQGRTPRDAVKAIAPLYAEGATPHAEVIQIFYHALDRSSLLQSLANELINAREGDKGLTDFDYYKKHISKTTLIHSKMSAMISQKLGLTQQLSTTHISKSGEGSEMDDDYQQLIHQLPGGIYRVTCTNHAGVFIKTADERFLFDPNRGTLDLHSEQAAAALWDLRTAHNGPGFMHFTSMALAVQ